MIDSTTVLAVATVLLGAMTAWLAWLTRQGLKQQAHHFTAAQQHAVLPFPVIEGSIFYRNPEDNYDPELPEPARREPSAYGSPLRVHNLGQGPALYLQWSFTFPALGGGTEHFESIGRYETRPLHLPQQATHELWHRLPNVTNPATIGDRGRIVLWYKDTFGREYHCNFEMIHGIWTELFRNVDSPLPQGRWHRRREVG